MMNIILHFRQSRQSRCVEEQLDSGAWSGIIIATNCFFEEMYESNPVIFWMYCRECFLFKLIFYLGIFQRPIYRLNSFAAVVVRQNIYNPNIVNFSGRAVCFVG